MVLFAVPIGLLLRRSRDTALKTFEPDFTRIRCPQCGWRPAKSDTWVCDPGCGHVWNTFDTRGVCPSCDKRWTRTACHRCGVWSDHDAWYERSQE